MTDKATAQVPEPRAIRVTTQTAPRLLDLSRAFNAEDGHPLDERGEMACAAIAAGDPLGHAWLIYTDADKEPAGYVIVTVGFSMEHGGRDGFLDEIYVVPDKRGLGLGTWILDFAEEQARALGIVTLHLEVERANTRAQALYRSRSYQGTDRIIMSKRL